MSALYKESLSYSPTSPSEDDADLRQEENLPIDVLRSDLDKILRSSCKDVERE